MSAEPSASPDPPGGARNLGVLSVRALLVGLRGNVLTVVLQPFVLRLGASVAFLGLLETIGGYRGIVPTAVQPAGGWVADRAGRKAVLLAASMATAASLLVLAVAGRLSAVALLVPAAVLLGLNGAGRPAADALVGESAGRGEIGRAYSRVTFGWALAGVFASLGAGYLADRLGFPPVFAIAAAIEVVAVALLAWGVQETLAAPRRRPRLAPGELHQLTLGIFAVPAGLRSLYLAVVLDAFFYGAGSALLYGFLADRYGYTPFQFGIMTTAFSLLWAGTQLPVGRWVDQGRAKQSLVAAEVLNAVVIASWLVTSEFWVFVVSLGALGIVSALWTPALLTWLFARVPIDRRAQEMGRLSAVTGLLAFPAPFLGGLLYDRLGFTAPIALNLIGILAATAIFVVAVPELPRPQPPEPGR